MGEMKKLLEDYGADYDETMSRFMGNEAMYLRFLNMLFEDGNLKKLGDAVSAENLDAAFEAAHTLKGVVGNMGLAPLYKTVCAIVEPLRARKQNVEYEAMFADILAEFEAADALRKSLKEAFEHHE